jgi:hypothetical protein
MLAGLDVSPGSKTAQKIIRKKYEQPVTCSKLSAVVAFADSNRKNKVETKGLMILKRNLKRKELLKL